MGLHFAAKDFNGIRESTFYRTGCVPDATFGERFWKLKSRKKEISVRFVAGLRFYRCQTLNRVMAARTRVDIVRFGSKSTIYEDEPKNGTNIKKSAGVKFRACANG